MSKRFFVIIWAFILTFTLGANATNIPVASQGEICPKKCGGALVSTVTEYRESTSHRDSRVCVHGDIRVTDMLVYIGVTMQSCDTCGHTPDGAIENIYEWQCNRIKTGGKAIVIRRKFDFERLKKEAEDRYVGEYEKICPLKKNCNGEMKMVVSKHSKPDYLLSRTCIHEGEDERLINWTYTYKLACKDCGTAKSGVVNQAEWICTKLK